MNKKINLFDHTFSQLESILQRFGQQKFRAQQLCHWLYKKLIFHTSLMLNIPDKLKSVIEEHCSMKLPKVHHVAHSKTDNSYKFLLKTHDNKLIESILMVEENRVTLCVSCMVGCPLACKFCATGTEIGFVRKLEPSEIIGQFLVPLRYAREHKIADKITNIVFMGMGEPFLNQTNVTAAIDIFTHPKCIALSPSKISVSTAGVGPGIANFVNKTQIRLAVSIHFPTDEQRTEYMPVNKHFSLSELITELQKIDLKKRDYILIEYLMLGGINDSLDHAKKLHKLLANLKVKINLIPYNPTKTLSAQTSSEETINAFATYLRDKGTFTSIRRSRGIEVSGGCGQFALKK